jgi:hypothetical protein
MNSDKDGLANVLPMKSTIFLYIILFALISSCNENGGDSKSLSFTVDGQSRRVHQTEAEKLLGFAILLPTFLPSGTANAPELKIQRAFGGDRG